MNAQELHYWRDFMLENYIRRAVDDGEVEHVRRIARQYASTVLDNTLRRPWLKITCVTAPSRKIVEKRGRRKVISAGLSWVVFDKAQCRDHYPFAPELEGHPSILSYHETSGAAMDALRSRHNDRVTSEVTA